MRGLVGSFFTVCEHLPLVGRISYAIYCWLPFAVCNGSTCPVCEREYGKDWFFRSLRSRSPDHLTLCEADDVMVSLAEIKAGKSKKFNNVEAFLKELKD